MMLKGCGVLQCQNIPALVSVIKTGIEMSLMRMFSKGAQTVLKRNVILKNIDWIKLEKSLVLRGLENNLLLLQKKVDKLHGNDDKVIEDQISKLPNYVHPRIWSYGNNVKEILRYTPTEKVESQIFEFSELCKHLNSFRMDHLGCYTGHKSYYLFGRLAELEHALIQHAIDTLKKAGFRILSVPDILPEDTIRGCGMQTDGDRSQVYKLESGKCLSGTAEMAIAGFLSNKTFKECELPLKYAAVSRCYRAETSGLNEEKGIYRVHQFSKVEMFSVCQPNQSEEMVENFKDIQTNIFKNLNINFRLLDMPPTELGASAYQKYDIETWMPGRKMWGEISSCSNCTDYQSKRLNITYIRNDGSVDFTHTVNGTASAIPRLLISLIESNQVDKHTVKIPNALKGYLKKRLIEKEKAIPEIKFVKYIKQIRN